MPKVHKWSSPLKIPNIYIHIYLFILILWVATSPAHINLLDLVIPVTFHEQQKL